MPSYRSSKGAQVLLDDLWRNMVVKIRPMCGIPPAEEVTNVQRPRIVVVRMD